MNVYRYVLPPPPPPDLLRLWNPAGARFDRVSRSTWPEDRWRPADQPDTALTWDWLLQEERTLYDWDPHTGESGWRPGTTPPSPLPPATLARYPAEPAQATARALYRDHLAAAVHAFRRLHATPDPASGPDDPEHRYWTIALAGNFATAWLLRELSAHVPDAADRLARDLWAALEVGDRLDARLRHWLVDEGIDPEPILDPYPPPPPFTSIPPASSTRSPSPSTNRGGA